MASVGHVIVGMAASRLYEGCRELPSLSSMAFWSALALVPDADVVGRSFGVVSGTTWAHRGATHSFCFAVVTGLLIGLTAPQFKRPAARTAVTAVLVLLSHPLLDMLTNGGSGIEFFWPFDTGRYFAPWNPIPVAPIGLAYLTPYGLLVGATELVIFSPVLLFALWPRRRA
jgi:inner membrane protein